MIKLNNSFFDRDVLDVAPSLLGKVIVRQFDSGLHKRYRITETEAYRGEADLACHASKGRTKRTEIMYHKGGNIYVYLIYGMYWLLNFVTSEVDYPAAVLIRGVEGFSGPGRVGKELELDDTFYGENINNSKRIWIEDEGHSCQFSTSERIGVDYSGEWAKKCWRFSALKTE